MSVDRFERVTDLLAFLLTHPTGATYDDIVNQVPGYPAGAEARRRAFERDKKLLRDEGVPLHEDGGRYRVPPEEYELPDLGLTPEEQVALRVALAAVPVGGEWGPSALHKVAPAAGEPGMAPAVAALGEHPLLPAVHVALRRRCPITFRYGGDVRTVEPMGLWFRDGWWYLRAWDQLRDGERTFRIDRIEGELHIGEAGSAPARPGPRTEALPRQPWLLPVEEPAMAEVMVDAVMAAKAIADAGEAAEVDRHDDGSVTLRLPVTHRPAFRSWLLGFLDHARVVAPPSLRAEIVSWLETVARGAR